MGYALKLEPSIQKDGMTKKQFTDSLSHLNNRLNKVEQTLSIHIQQDIQNYYYDCVNVLNSINQKYS